MTNKIISIPIKIVPKARPRIGKYGNWYSPSSKDEETLGLLILREMKLRNIKREEIGKLSIKLVIGFKEKKRADIDNYIKQILDSCNGILWGDDKNIYKLNCEIREKTLDYLEINIEKLKDN